MTRQGTDRRITQDRARALFLAGNNEGEGYRPEGETIAEAVGALVAAGGAVLLSEPVTKDGVALVEMPCGKLVAVGDAHGAWAVDLRG